MSSWFGQVHDFTEKWDPLGHAMVDGMHKSSTAIVNESSRAMEKIGDKWGWNTKIPAYGKKTSQKDKDSINRWGDNTVGAAAAVFGGMSAAGGSSAGGGAAGGTAGASGGAAGAGTAVGDGILAAELGSGAAYGGAGGIGGAGVGMGGTGATAAGGELGASGAETAFDPNGLPEGSKYASDIPTQGGGSWMDKLTGSMGGMGGGQGGGAQAQQQQGPSQPPNMGNPALTAALSKLVQDQEEAKRQEENGPFARAVNYQQQPQGESLDEIIRRLSQAYAANNQGGGNGWVA